MSTHRLELPAGETRIRPVLPRLGGTSPRGDTIGVTNASLTWNAAPWQPVAGEIHYARLPRGAWREALLAMKDGGIDIASVYVFWIHHEEEQGIFDWSGDRDLRGFVEECAATGMLCIVRLGPFCHGEVRNGGLPDWLYGQPFRVRSNDPGYLAYVRRLYGEIARQVKGLSFKDGGPIIGLQLENELLHAGAPWETTPRLCMERTPVGFDGIEHLRKLKEIALDAGLVAPLYTVTGWGGAAILPDETLPLYGGYAYCPWNVTTENPVHRPTAEYLFRDFSSQQPGVPYASCELGGGMQCWYGYRFVVDPRSAEAMALVRIAGGCSLPGYYMYHGGTNPVGKHGFLNEHVTPRISYDFQAPLGELGQERASARYLRRLHHFLSSFGNRLPLMTTLLPRDAAGLTPDNVTSLRWAARAREDEGFLFLCNFQDHAETVDHRDVSFTLPLRNGGIRIPRDGGFTLRSRDSAILPFNLDLGGIRLLASTAQPLTVVHAVDGPHFIFFEHDGMPAQYCFDETSLAGPVTGAARTSAERARLWVLPTTGLETPFVVKSTTGAAAVVHTLGEADSLRCHLPLLWGQRRLVLCDAQMFVDGETLVLTHRGAEAPRLDLSIFPAVDGGLACDTGELSVSASGATTRVEITLPARAVAVEVAPVDAGISTVRVAASSFDGLRELVLSVDYDGDVGNAFVDGELVADDFASGARWEIGLGRLRERLREAPLCLRVTPRREGTVVVTESAMAMKTELRGRQIAEIRGVRAEPVRQVRVTPAR